VTSPPPDPGLANERTSLAWQRTALSVVAGSALLARLTVADLGLGAVVALLVSVGLGLWIMSESRRRYVGDGPALRSRPRGGRAPAALALATLIVGLIELVWLLGDLAWAG
jgi:uncharacterized membrane protein YidH (DUF202 family)